MLSGLETKNPNSSTVPLAVQDCKYVKNLSDKLKLEKAERSALIAPDYMRHNATMRREDLTISLIPSHKAIV